MNPYSIVIVFLIFLVYEPVSARSNSCRGNQETDCINQDINSSLFEPFVKGRNNCFLAQMYFPKDLLESLLPEDLAIPSEETMRRIFPSLGLAKGDHPFLISFCHGSQIRDIWTQINLPDQEELMAIFPVIYTHLDGKKYLCSYIPVLYLDSPLGVLGGLYYGLRKEFHSRMEHDHTDHSMMWRIRGLLEGSFAMEDIPLRELPKFVEQIFASPFVTKSYPPLSRLFFYQAKVFPNEIRRASSIRIVWQYKGAVVESSERTLGTYIDYEFAMSSPMSARSYF